MTRHLRPTPLEIAAGRMLGEDPAAPALPEVDPALTPLEALRESVLPALRRPPCLVTFSGGRDSSAVLAVAVEVARREGLPLPVPVTVRFSGAPGSSEPEWQEAVIGHLGLEEWLRLEVAEELDLVGPVAGRILRRHGLVYPVNASLFLLLLEQAAGGSLLTGIGGDSMLGGWLFWHPAEVLARRGRPRPGDLLLAGYALTPPPARRLVTRHRTQSLPWLRPDVQRLVAREQGDAAARAPLRWGDHLALCLRQRSLVGAVGTISLLADDAGALVAHPLIDPRFAAALARAGGWHGLGSRTSVMRALFGGLLPDELLSRSSKAQFLYVYFRAASREFARRFGGEGLDPDAFDVEALRATWLSLMPPGTSALPLQAAWLASAGGEVEQPLADLG